MEEATIAIMFLSLPAAVVFLLTIGLFFEKEEK